MRWQRGTFILLIAPACLGAGYPDKPIRIVTPYPAASVTDVVARPLAAKFLEAWSQPVIVDNRPGAGGTVAADIVAKSPPDGYTLLIASTAPNAVNASLYKKMPYDTLRDFAPISLAATNYLFLVTHPSVPARTVKELIALARANPGQLNFPSSGNGSTTHLGGELFKYMTATSMTHIPYKGSPQYTVDLIAGRIELGFASPTAVLPHIKTGRLRLLAMSSDKRDPSMPEVPTISESGVPGYELKSWYGLVASAGTPAEIIDKVQAELAKILIMADVKAQYAVGGLTAVGSSSAEFAAYIKTEFHKWAQVVKAAGIRAD